MQFLIVFHCAVFSSRECEAGRGCLIGQRPRQSAQHGHVQVRDGTQLRHGAAPTPGLPDGVDRGRHVLLRSIHARNAPATHPRLHVPVRDDRGGAARRTWTAELPRPSQQLPRGMHRGVPAIRPLRKRGLRCWTWKSRKKRWRFCFFVGSFFSCREKNPNFAWLI